MILKKELMAKIKDYFDLNEYESKVWLALISKGIASAGEVAKISGVPRSRTYDVLETLEKRGFAIVKLGKPVKYIGVKPETVLEKLKNNVKKDASERVNLLSRIKESEEFEKIKSLYTEGIHSVKREDLSASLKGKSNITHYLKEIIQNAEKEVVVCTDVEDISCKIALFKQTFNQLKKENIKIIIALRGKQEKIKNLEKIFELKIKKIDIHTKFFLIDKKEILFYLSKDSGDEDTAVWLNSPFFVNAFLNLFQRAVR
jgi:HTH-type transcriptional regulator, sugar sensing transcriptional regulator